MNNSNRFLMVVLFAFVAAASFGYLGTGPFWWQIQEKPTTLSGYGITDAASDEELAAHTASNTDVHGCSVVASASAVAGVQTNLDTHTATETAHGLPNQTGNDGKFLKLVAGDLTYADVPAATSLNREDVEQGVATTTVTFGSVTIDDFSKCMVLINGVGQKYTNFTKTNSTQIESTQGSMQAGTLVTLMRFD